MKLNKITGRRETIQKIIDIFPKGFRLRLNPRMYFIEKFVKKSAKSLKEGSRVLDAGAGPCPYNGYFKHCNYEATDIIDPRKEMDFVCSLSEIPRQDNYYDAILNTEVLEHVEYPQKVINEFRRVLKKGGKLILTAPQGWRIHQAPHNYFYFTSYGLKSILKNAGFSKYKITPMGGYFWFLADAIRFNNLLEPLKNKPWAYYPLAILGYPLTQLIIPFILFHLDFIDKKREWTMGYVVEAVK